MIYLGLGALALVVVALMLAPDGDGSGGVMTPDTLANLAYTGLILALVAAGFWRRMLAAPVRSLQALAAWVLIGAALVLGYSYRDRIQDVSARVMGDLRPGAAVSGAGGTVTVTRRSDGTFRVEAAIDGRRQDFLFDTGAGSVVLTSENAASLGIRPKPDDFNARVWTANGPTYAAPIQLASLTVGTITERNVNAMVARPGALAANLLGQTFLDRLGSYEVRGDRLILTPKR